MGYHLVAWLMMRGCYCCFVPRRSVVRSIQALLSAPNPDDPLADAVAQHWKANEAEAMDTGEDIQHSIILRCSVCVPTTLAFGVCKECISTRLQLPGLQLGECQHSLRHSLVDGSPAQHFSQALVQFKPTPVLCWLSCAFAARQWTRQFAMQT